VEEDEVAKDEEKDEVVKTEEEEEEDKDKKTELLLIFIELCILYTYIVLKKIENIN